MATKTTYFKLNKPVGSDLYNPLTDTVPNFDLIDTQMHANQVAGVPKATETYSGGTHRIVRSVKDAAMFRFTASAANKGGDLWSVDGVSLTPVYSNGNALQADAYKAGAEVLCAVVETRIVFYIAAPGSTDAETLDGHDSLYFATASQMETTTAVANAAQILANSADDKATKAQTAADRAEGKADQALAKPGGMTMDLLWTNPSPNTVPEYKVFEVPALNNYDIMATVWMTNSVGDSTTHGISITFGALQSITGKADAECRFTTPINGSGSTMWNISVFYNSTYKQLSLRSPQNPMPTDANRCPAPYKVYGIKI